MRITDAHRFYNFQNNQQSVTSNLNKVFDQLSSGLKIKFGNEDPTAFINTLRLDQEVNTLNQSTANMTASQKFANHTDKTLNEMTKSLEQFKTRLVSAANEVHSSTSISALAKELEGIKTHIMNLANTNINGEYLFSGSATSIQPITGEGEYNGNDLKMKTLTGSNIESAYNISGAELFLGQDEDYNKSITTNVVLYNQEKLHPSVMKEDETSDDQATKEYITELDTIRELVGDNDDDTTNDGSYNFYVSGVNSSGTAFKEKIDLNTDQNVDELLHQIGNAYGNTLENKVVDVKMNQGRIEIHDLQEGSSKLDFHMFGSSQDVDDPAYAGDIDAMVANGADIKEFVKSPFDNIPTMSSIKPAQSQYDPHIHNFNTLFKTQSDVAIETTSLSDIFPSNVGQIAISGSDTQGNAINPLGTPPGEITLNVAGNDVKDLLQQIETTFSTPLTATTPPVGGDVTARITKDGHIQIETPETDGGFTIELETRDTSGAAPVPPATYPATNGFENNFAASKTVEFEVEGAYVRSNVAQVVTATNEFATDKTKLSEVASTGSVVGSTMNIPYTDINGNKREAQMQFNGAPNNNVVVVIDDDGTAGFDPVTDTSFTVLDAEYDDLNNNNAYDVGTGEERQTQPDNMTYKQLNDVMSMLVTNEIPADLDRTDYNTKIDNARNRVDVYIDDTGMMTIKDNISSQTDIRFGIYDTNANNYGAGAAESKLTFAANNSIIIDDVHANLFDTLNKAIEAVEAKLTRPDADNEEFMRNPGIQNLIERLDHMHDHTVRKHTEIGAISQSFDYQISRNETLVIHTKSLRSDIIDVDYGEAAMKLSQLQMNYQAMASSMAKIQGLSLVNYL